MPESDDISWPVRLGPGWQPKKMVKITKLIEAVEVEVDVDMAVGR